MHPHRVSEIKEFLVRWSSDASLVRRFPLYSGYLSSLANAERLTAVHSYLRPLIGKLKLDSHSGRLDLIYSICRTVDHTDRTAGTSPVPGLPHELLEEIAIPTLLEQRRAHPDDAYANVWLALLPMKNYLPELPSARELLKIAYDLVPNDEFVDERVAQERLHSIQFSCHHLPEALLDSAASVVGYINELRQFLAAVTLARKEFYVNAANYCAKEVDDFVRQQTPNC